MIVFLKEEMLGMLLWSWSADCSRLMVRTFQLSRLGVLQVLFRRMLCIYVHVSVLAPIYPYRAAQV